MNNNYEEIFYLKTPSLNRKNEIIDYINEFVEYKLDINGMGLLDKILDGYTLERALEGCLNMHMKNMQKNLEGARERPFYLLGKTITKLLAQSTLGGL